MTKTAIITGASRGIGRACAALFARNGYQVLINYLNSQDEALELCERLQKEGRSAATFRADVSDATQTRAMAEFCLNRFSGVDLLINNAGISKPALFTEIAEADWDEIIRVNLKGVYLCTQAVLAEMIRVKRGKIINISSIWGLVGASCEVHYSAAKAGVIGLTKALAKELGPSNIQVNCIAPGVIATDMLNDYSQADLDDLKSQTPLLRLGTPEDIAACALFLASEAADFLTGQVISPNGGMVV
jgi:3-oxoacyl-[acyl-carrier protein] reductase